MWIIVTLSQMYCWGTVSGIILMLALWQKVLESINIASKEVLKCYHHKKG